MVSSASPGGSCTGAALGESDCKGNGYKTNRNGGYKVDIIASAIAPLSLPVLPESTAAVGFADRFRRIFQTPEFALSFRNRSKLCTMPCAKHGDAFINSGTGLLHRRESTSYEWLLQFDMLGLCKTFGEVCVGRIEKSWS